MSNTEEYSNIKEKIIYKNQKNNANNIDNAANFMANEISIAIHDKIEGINIFNPDFKRQIKLLFLKILKEILKAEERTSVYYEVIPGFSLISFRKKLVNSSFSQSEEIKELNKEEGLTKKELESITSSLVSKYLNETNDNIVVIENDFVFMLFFPVSNLEKNLKDLDFYYTK